MAEKAYRQEQQGIGIEVIGLSFSSFSFSFFLSLLLESRLKGLVAISIEEELLLVALICCDFRGPKEVSSNLGKG